MKEILFTVDDVKYKVRQPTKEERDEADKVYHKAFANALTNGAFLQEAATKVLREQGLWTDDLEKRMETVARKIKDKEVLLHKGGIKLSDARNIALEIKRLRNEYAEIVLPITRFNVEHTADGYANNSRFNYLVSCCLVYENNSKVFNNVDEYLNNADQRYAEVGASKFASLHNNLSEDFEAGLPENKFLKEWKFMDSEGRLINKDGKLITEDGRLINEKGRLVDEDGNLIDVDGNLVDEDGNLLIKSQPFLNDDGQEIEAVDSKKDSAKSRKKTE